MLVVVLVEDAAPFLEMESDGFWWIRAWVKMCGIIASARGLMKLEIGDW